MELPRAQPSVVEKAAGDRILLVIVRWRHTRSTSLVLKQKTNKKLNKQEIHSCLSAGVRWVIAHVGNH